MSPWYYPSVGGSRRLGSEQFIELYCRFLVREGSVCVVHKLALCISAFIIIENILFHSMFSVQSTTTVPVNLSGAQLFDVDTILSCRLTNVAPPTYYILNTICAFLKMPIRIFYHAQVLNCFCQAWDLLCCMRDFCFYSFNPQKRL